MSRPRFVRAGITTLAALLTGALLAPPAALAAATGTVSGILTTAAGSPVAGASITAYDSDYSYLTDATTSASGAYSLRGVPAGTVKIEYYTNGDSQWAHDKLDFDTATELTVVAGQTLRVDESLLPTGTLTGLLTDSTGAPAAWVNVAARSNGATVYGYTDETGRYTLAVRPGEYRLRFNWEQAVQWATGAGDEQAASVFTVAVGETVQADDQLMPTGSLGGHLAGITGEPLTGAEVTLHRDDNYAARTETDDNGDYLFPGVSPGDAYKVSFTTSTGVEQWIAGKAAASTATELKVTAGQRTTADDRLIAPGRLEGRLTAANGSGLSGYEVLVSLGGEEGGLWRYATTDARGAWSIANLPAGDYLVAFTNPQASRRQWAYGKNSAADAELVAVAPGATVTVDDTWLPGATLTVAPVDAVTGAPVTHFCAMLSTPLSPGDCTTGSQLVLEDLPAGDYQLQITLDDPSSLYLRADGVPISLTSGGATTSAPPLRQGGRISILVKDRATGQPVTGTCFATARLGRGGLPDGYADCTDSTGRVTTRSVLEPEVYELFAVAPSGYGHQWVGESGGTGRQEEAAQIEVSSGAVTEAPEVLLDRPGAVKGTVTGSTGAAATGGSVSLTAWDFGVGPGWFTHDLNARGEFTIPDLGPYEWPLLFDAYGDARQYAGGVGERFSASRVTVVAGATTSFDVALSAPGSMTGSVTAAEGRTPLWWRLTAVNAVTGDPVGVIDGTDSGAYAMRLLGGQTVKVRYNAEFAGGSYAIGWVGGTDQASATEAVIPTDAAATFDAVLG